MVSCWFCYFFWWLSCIAVRVGLWGCMLAPPSVCWVVVVLLAPEYRPFAALASATMLNIIT